MGKPAGLRTALGFDYGRVRIGVAVGQELTATASPLSTLTARGRQPDWAALDRLIQEWQPEVLVVGVPWHADGTPNAVTKAALAFAEALGRRYRLAVETIDERLSSQEAQERLAAGGRPRQRKEAVDALAAALILESWLRHRQPAVDAWTERRGL